MLLHNHPEYWNFRAFEILYPVLNQELQNHDPVGRHIPV